MCYCSLYFFKILNILYLTLILLRLFQQHYCYNVTGQSQESEGSYKPARIKEVHSKLHSFQAGIIIHTILNLWETPGIEPVTSGLTSVYCISLYQARSSTA